MDQDEFDRKQKDFFNRICYEWASHPDSNRESIDEMMDCFGIKGDEKILDVATGIGVLIPSYVKRLTTGTVFGVDYTPNMIKLAKERYENGDYPNVHFREQNIFTLEEKDEYDMIVCYSCFPHFLDHDGAVRILSEALRSGGRFIVCNLNYHHSDGGDRPKKGMEGMPEHRFITMPDLIAFIYKHGMTLEFVRNDDEMTVIKAVKKT